MILFHDLSTTPDWQTRQWVCQIANDLRQTDKDEIRATNPTLTIGDPDPEAILWMSIRYSKDAWVITKDDVAFCIFGAGPSGDPELGTVWLLASTVLDTDRKAKIAVAKNTKTVVQNWHRHWPKLANWIDIRNVMTLRWLTWAGFEIKDVDLQHGREKRPFYFIQKTKEDAPDV